MCWDSILAYFTHRIVLTLSILVKSGQVIGSFVQSLLNCNISLENCPRFCQGEWFVPMIALFQNDSPRRDREGTSSFRSSRRQPISWPVFFRRDCDQEFFSVQAVLRTALCSPPPAIDEQLGSSSGGEGITNPQLAMVGSHRARACLLVGHLVESGAPGWEETKASMVPPPRHLMEASTEDGTYDLGRGSR